MGFLGLVPADKLAASYNPATHSLTLYAQGEARKYTYGINFRRVTWLGGLKFQLDGWTGPLGEGSMPYTYEQSFSIQLPSRALPSGDVVIVTLNHPQGQVVPIRWLGLKAPPQASGTENKSLSNSDTSTSSQLIVANATQINALYKEPFEIKQATEVPKFGTVNIKYDTKFLILTDASIDDTNIVWTFNSLQTGDTQVIVTVHGGIATYVLQKTYDVHIFVLDAAAAPTTTLRSSAQAGTSSEPHGNEILSFLGFVNIAVRLVKEKYSDAQLYEVQATLPAGDPTPNTNPLGLSQLQVVFRAGNGTVLIKSPGWGTWGQPQYIDEPWLEDVVIPWPVEMDITDAVTLLQKAGYTGSFQNCTLRHPLGPPGKPNDEPYYIFQMEDGIYVFVGINDGAIYVNKAGQALLPDKCEAVLRT